MNTQVSVVRSHKSKDNLVILADYKDFSWTADFLDKAEQQFLTSASKREIPHVLIPQAHRIIIVQFLNNNPVGAEDRENARVAGCDLLNTLAHYKLESVTLLNQRKVNRTAEFLEGMILGNYQFLKYFKDKASKSNPLRRINVVQAALSKKILNELLAVTESTCVARDLVNEPQSYLSPPNWAKRSRPSAKRRGLKSKYWTKRRSRP